jgi:hypothetical protein
MRHPGVLQIQLPWSFQTLFAFGYVISGKLVSDASLRVCIVWRKFVGARMFLIFFGGYARK